MKKLPILFAALVLSGSSLAQQLDFSQSGHFAILKLPHDQYAHWNEDAFSKDLQTVQSYTKQVYDVLQDNFDFLVFVRNEREIEPFSYYGTSTNVSNDVSGIGMTISSNANKYGSAGRLQQVIHMASRDVITNGPFLHEILHRWANHAFPTVYSGHWGYMGGNTKGQIGGFAQSSLKSNVDNVANKYSVDYFGTNANGGNAVPYNQLELYMMGLIPLDSVSPFTSFTKVSNVSVDPQTGTTTFTSDERVDYTPTSIKNLLGDRTPDYTTSQKNFNVLFIVVTENDLASSDVKTVEDAISSMCARSAISGGLYNFFSATGGRATLSTGILTDFFKSTPPSITITAPLSESVVYNFSTVPISWQTALSGNVRIDAYQRGAFLCNIASGVPASAGSYNWNVDLSDLYDSSDISIRITSESNPMAYTFSPAPFDVKTRQFIVSGKVLNDKNEPVADAVVTSGSKAPYISASFSDVSANHYYRLCTTVEQPFVAAEPTITSVGIKPRVVDKTVSIEIGILSPDKSKIIASMLVPRDNLINREINRFDFEKPVYVVPGETYYLYFLDPDYGTGSDVFYYYEGDNEHPVYRVWSTDGDGNYTTTAADGSYSLALPEQWSGSITAVADGLDFPRVGIKSMNADLTSVDIIQGAETFTDLPTTIADGVTITPSSGFVTVSGFSGSAILYDLTGVPVSSGKVSSSPLRLYAPRHGLYVLSLGSSSILIRL